MILRSVILGVFLGFLVLALNSCGSAVESSKQDNKPTKQETQIFNAEGVYHVQQDALFADCLVDTDYSYPNFIKSQEKSFTINQKQNLITVIDDQFVFSGEVTANDMRWSGQVTSDLAGWLSITVEQTEFQTNSFTATMHWQARRSIDGDVQCYGETRLSGNRIDNVIPATPSNVSATALSSRSIQILWQDQSENETGFILEKANPLNGNFSVERRLPANSSSTIQMFLQEETDYQFRLRSFNNIGMSEPSETVSATTPAVAMQAPVAPSGLTAIQTERGIELTWIDNSDNEVDFYIARSVQEDNDDAYIGFAKTLGTNTTKFIDRKRLQANTDYFYRLQAFNQAGRSAYASVTITTQAETDSRPQKVSALRAQALSENSVSLRWQDNADNEDGFLVLRSVSSPTTGYQLIANLGQNTRGFVDSDLEPLKTYFYMVVANNAMGDADTIDAVSVTTLQVPNVLPSAVFDFKVKSLSSSHAILTWSNASDNNASAFVIERSLNENDDFETIAQPLSGALTYTDTGMIAGTTYYYRMKAINSFGESDYSVTLIASAFDNPPNPPSVLRSPSATTSSISLSWNDNSDNEDGFQIERSDDPDAAQFQLIATVDANITIFEDNNLGLGFAPFSLHHYRIRAVNEAGNSVYSSPLSAYTLKQVPLAPQNFSVDTTQTTLSSVLLSWDYTDTDNSRIAEQFEIQYAINDIANNISSVSILDAATRSFTIDDLQAGTTYVFRMFSRNSGGVSDYTSTQSETTLSPLNAPSQLVAQTSDGIQQSIDLSWLDNSNNENGFNIYRSSSAAGPFDNLIASVPANTQFFEDSEGLAVNARYYYRISAYNAFGETGLSNQATAVTLVGAPSTPGNLAIAAGSVTASSMRLTWTYDDPADHIAEEFYFQRTVSGSNLIVGIRIPRNEALVDGSFNAYEYTDSNLGANLTYAYRMYAQNNGGSSDWSTTVSAKTLKLPPPVPVNVRAESVNVATLNVFWDQYAGASDTSPDGFKVQRSVKPANTPDAVDNFSDLATVNGVNATVTTDATTGTACRIYSYRVNSFNNGGESDFSTTTSLTRAPTALATAPGNLAIDVSVTPTPPTSFNVVLNWSDLANNESGYEVQRWFFPVERGYSSQQTFGANQTTFSQVVALSDIPQGTTAARYRVLAKNACGSASAAVQYVIP